MPYTPTQAGQKLGMSPATIRNYTSSELLRSYFSPGATPGAGSARILGEQDLHLLKFIRDATRIGQTLQEVAARLHEGALDDMPEEEAPEPPPASAAPQDNAALVAIVSAQLERRETQVQELSTALLDASKELARAQGTIDALLQRIAALETQLSDKEELARLRSELEGRKTFWQRLTGH